ncbi:hypothetical protein QCA50_014788 [Cerrena zonata]|uniref:Uncharacterized protein n=1 Tax=Cerrena zonata TaxID=2478898 RepID=A0AAW0FXV7_9APHY
MNIRRRQYLHADVEEGLRIVRDYVRNHWETRWATVAGNLAPNFNESPPPPDPKQPPLFLEGSITPPQEGSAGPSSQREIDRHHASGTQLRTDSAPPSQTTICSNKPPIPSEDKGRDQDKGKDKGKGKEKSDCGSTLAENQSIGTPVVRNSMSLPVGDASPPGDETIAPPVTRSRSTNNPPSVGAVGTIKSNTVTAGNTLPKVPSTSLEQSVASPSSSTQPLSLEPPQRAAQPATPPPGLNRERPTVSAVPREQPNSSSHTTSHPGTIPPSQTSAPLDIQPQSAATSALSAIIRPMVQSIGAHSPLPAAPSSSFHYSGPSLKEVTDIPFLERLEKAYREEFVELEVKRVVLNHKLGVTKKVIEDIQQRISSLKQGQCDVQEEAQEAGSQSFGQPVLLMDQDDPMEGPSTLL